MRRALPLSIVMLAALSAVPAAHARTVYRCVQKGTVSLATAPEPGSKCEAKQIADDAAKLPNLWGMNGTQRGTLYQREQDGVTVYSTRDLPGSVAVLNFSVTPPDSPAHAGLGALGAPQPKVHAPLFQAAAKANRIDDAWLRAIAHAESGFAARAVSPKGAQGVMQLMPATARLLHVRDPFSPAQSIDGGARYLAELLRRFGGDRRLAAAAYNAGPAAVAKYGGVPPYAETRAYVEKVEALRVRYAAALSSRTTAL
jgi:soluble lytic murein transglycosylase-like protein